MNIRTPPKLTNRSSVIKFLMIDLWSWLRDLTIGLKKISFQDNFQSFTVQNIKIPAGTEVSIANQFKSVYPGFIPSGRIIIRQQGDANIIDGLTSWTSSSLYLRNPSGNDAVVTVLFFM
jgi:hypothetical protein